LVNSVKTPTMGSAPVPPGWLTSPRPPANWLHQLYNTSRASAWKWPWN